jgi:hypothetical protein
MKHRVIRILKLRVIVKLAALLKLWIGDLKCEGYAFFDAVTKALQ